MKIKIIAVGKLKDKNLQSVIFDYTKQLKDLEIIEVLDEKSKEGMEKEAQRVLEKISPNDYIVSLAIEGKMYDSVEFASLIDHTFTHGLSTLVFIIGGSYGIHPSVKSKSHQLISFSKMTFPHQLMRLILVEQIYRAFKILEHHPYHK
jgi:23S rRNA (pseudouridine1915-N3)-methyltransferase